MYKKTPLLIVLVLLFFASCSQSSAQNESSLLWKVSGNGLEKPSYLFGTHHLIPIAFLDSVSGLHEVFEATEQTVGELDMTDMTLLQQKILSESLMPDGLTYDSLISYEDGVLLNKTLIDLIGTGLSQLGQMKPAVLSNLIGIKLYQKYYPTLSGEKSIDQYFQEEALKRSRPIVGLETVEDQIFVLVQFRTLERQAEMLMCMVKHPELLKQQMDGLQAGYHAQNVHEIYDFFEKTTPDDPCPNTQEERDVLNKNRNEKWLEKLPEIMKEKSSFIAVGCLHLPGNDGLIEGLRSKGYTVEPIN